MKDAEQSAANLVSVFGFALLAVLESMIYDRVAGWAKPISDIYGLNMVFWLIPFAFALAFSPALRKAGADLALAAGAAEGWFLAVMHGKANVAAGVVINSSADVAYKALPFLGPIIGFALVWMLSRSMRKLSNRAVVLMPIAVTIVFAVERLVRLFIDLGFGIPA